VLDVAAQLAQQAGGPARRAVAQALAFQNLDARAAAGELHRCAEPGDAAANDDYVGCVDLRHRRPLNSG
jgi:hypothetical protein